MNNDSSHFSILDRCNQVTSLTISGVLPLINLRTCVSHLSKLRTLCIEGYAIDRRHEGEDECKWILDELLADQLLCNMLISCGLRKLVFDIPFTIPTAKPIIRLIVERLPQLQIIEVEGGDHQERPHLLHILINGLVHLAFLTVHCGVTAAKPTEIRLKALTTSQTRPFRSETFEKFDEGILFICV
jgi:hypothetical protein